MRRAVVALTLVALTAASAGAGEIGHYAGGLMNIRDLAVPEPGFYGALYNYGYLTSQLNDTHGGQSHSVAILSTSGGTFQRPSSASGCGQ